MQGPGSFLILSLKGVYNPVSVEYEYTFIEHVLFTLCITILGWFQERAPNYLMGKGTHH